jgi:hypothetical protein
MFRRGEIVTGPFPATQGNCNVGTHYLVVLDSTAEGTLVMFTTSLKEATGGACEFTAEERSQAQWSKPCRFDPSRIALYRASDLHHLRPTGGLLYRRTVERLILAGARAKASFVTFRAELRRVA